MTHGDACFAYFNKIWGIPHIKGASVSVQIYEYTP